MRQALMQLLRDTLPNADLIEAADAKTGIQLVEDAKPQILLMDLSMPGMDALDATRQLKQTLPSLPIIMLTFNDDELRCTEALQAGANAVVSKDNLATELVPTINQHARF